MSDPILEVRRLEKRYTRGLLRHETTFRLCADFTIADPTVVGVMGPNGSGKTTLFELITGSNTPTAGEVRCLGKNIHKVRDDQRDRLAIHYHQSYQVRRFRRTRPRFLMDSVAADYPVVHLFDEPQLNTQDGYIGFMLDFFRRLRGRNRLVFLCMHPNEGYHLEILREVCERLIFIDNGRLTHADSFDALLTHAPVRDYLGDLVGKPS